MSRLLFGALLCCALVAAGCASSNPAPTVCEMTALPVPPQMIYPVPSATGVPDGNFTLVMSYFDSRADVYLATSEISLGRLTPTAVPSPLPTPYATPRFSTTFAYSVGPLAPHTTYEVNGPPVPPSACPYNNTIGTFTTR